MTRVLAILLPALVLVTSVAACGRDTHGIEFAEESGFRCPDLVALAVASPAPVDGAPECLDPSARVLLPSGTTNPVHALLPDFNDGGGALDHVRFIGPGCPHVVASAATPAPSACGPSFAYWFAYQHTIRVLVLDVDRSGLISGWRFDPCRPLYC